MIYKYGFVDLNGNVWFPSFHSDIILVDMNLYKTDTEAFQILTDNHFVEVAELIDKDTTTAASDNVFDRIFLWMTSLMYLTLSKVLFGPNTDLNPM